MKTCSKCKEDKELSFYPRDKRNISGFGSWCKSCKSVASCKRNTERRKSDQMYRTLQNSRNRIRSLDPIFKARKNELSRIRNKERYWTDETFKLKQKKISIEIIKRKLKEDAVFKLKHNLRTLIRQSFRNNGYKKNSKTSEILGINFVDFLIYINHKSMIKYGIPYDSSMEIDHIVPLLTALTEEEVVKLNHYTNLQPLKIEDHVEKTKQDIKCPRKDKE